jgi:hypothetical protein
LGLSADTNQFTQKVVAKAIGDPSARCQLEQAKIFSQKASEPAFFS